MNNNLVFLYMLFKKTISLKKKLFETSKKVMNSHEKNNWKLNPQTKNHKSLPIMQYQSFFASQFFFSQLFNNTESVEIFNDYRTSYLV